MRRRDFVLLTAAALACPRTAAAQKKVPVVGLLWNDSVKPSPQVAIFVAAMRDKGYVLERDFRLDDRISLEGYGGYADSMAELVRAKVDVIVVNGSTAAVVAAKATKDIPIVTIIGQDPVALGLATSLPRPGGNVTGVATLTVDLTGKRIELLKETVPALSRLGVLLAPNVGNPRLARESQAVAKRLNLEVSFAEAAAPDEIEDRIAELAQARVGGIYVTASTMFAAHSKRVIDAITKHRLPAVYGSERYAQAGGLLNYGISTRRTFGRVAGYVDRILKGARPGELAIEQTTDLELVVNLKSARALGIKVPPTILVRADRVIE